MQREVRRSGYLVLADFQVALIVQNHKRVRIRLRGEGESAVLLCFDVLAGTSLEVAAVADVDSLGRGAEDHLGARCGPAVAQMNDPRRPRAFLELEIKGHFAFVACKGPGCFRVVAVRFDTNQVRGVRVRETCFIVTFCEFSCGPTLP